MGEYVWNKLLSINFHWLSINVFIYSIYHGELVIHISSIHFRMDFPGFRCVVQDARDT